MEQEETADTSAWSPLFTVVMEADGHHHVGFGCVGEDSSVVEGTSWGNREPRQGQQGSDL